MTPPPVELALDMWMALGCPVEEFDAYYQRNGWANTWAALCGTVRDVFVPRCGRMTDSGPCVLAQHSMDTCAAAGDVGLDEPLPISKRLAVVELPEPTVNEVGQREWIGCDGVAGWRVWMDDSAPPWIELEAGNGDWSPTVMRELAAALLGAARKAEGENR